MTESRGRHRAPSWPVVSALLARTPVRWALAAVLVVVVAVVAVVVGLGRPGVAVPGPDAFAGPPGHWRKVLADEFDGSRLDTRLWQPDRGAGEAGAIPFNPSLENAWFDPSAAQVSGGQLTLRVQQRSRTLQGRTYRYSSGMVQGAPGVVVRPGEYIQARIKIPGCDGCWPAFWLQPQDRWPPEIDIAEYLQSGHDQRPTFNYIDPHEHKTGPAPYGEDGADYRDAFHTYGVLWTGARAVPYLDGVAYPGAGASGTVTQLPLMILLNLSVRTGYDVPSGTEMVVDWVRVWEPVPSGG